jgi:hypothetical protein
LRAILKGQRSVYCTPQHFLFKAQEQLPLAWSYGAPQEACSVDPQEACSVNQQAAIA